MIRADIPDYWPGNWHNPSNIRTKKYQCGFCGTHVGASKGFHTHANDWFMAICPSCNWPTLFDERNKIRFPDSPLGESVRNVPKDVSALYNEARQAASAGAYTAAVMVCRKLLMIIAVKEQAQPNQSFQFYVDYLEKQQLFSPSMKAFVDQIRKLGNEATHEIAPKSRDDAANAIIFVQALLYHNYELPGLLKAPATP